MNNKNMKKTLVGILVASIVVLYFFCLRSNQVQTYHIDQNVVLNYTDDSEHLGHTFYNKMDSDERAYVACALEMYCKDNGLNSLFDFDPDTLECINNTVNCFVYTGAIGLHLTVDIVSNTVTISKEI